MALADPADDTMQAIDFDGQAGWWHPASGDVAVVVCPPIGRDGRCAYLPLRLLAERLAEAGYPALRFDYPGEGESLDVSEAADALPIWRDGVRNAVRFARRLGARQVVLAGLRVGATLAAELAEELDAAALALLAPVVSGRGWLRELKLRASMSAQVFRDLEPDTFTSDDLRLSPATVASLGAWRFRAPAVDWARPVFVASVTPGEVSSALRETAATVSEQAFLGYDALFDEPHSNTPPMALFDALVRWLKDTVPAGANPLMSPPHRHLLGHAWTEEGVILGAGLRGVICRPSALPPRDEGAVFLSTGADPRAGLGRFAVTASRALAEEGVASLRFDFSGVGDSAAATGRLRSHPFEDPRDAEIAAAVDFMVAAGSTSAVLIGICSGSFHAVRAAPRDPRVSGLYVVSLLRLVWRPGMSLSVRGVTEIGATRSYVEGLRDPKVWRRLVAGDIQVKRILKALAARAMARLRPDGSAREARGLTAELRGYAARGGRSRYILGVHDEALDELERWFGKDGRRLSAMPNTTVSVVPGLDHGLSYAHSRAFALKDLRSFLGLETAS